MELQIAISPGELIDRITILEIKRTRITDAGRLGNVAQVHDALSKILLAQIKASPRLSALTGELRSINEVLWQAEEDLRRHERRQLFDEDFIATARLVYMTNDRRSELKRQIDELLGSSLIEEKFYGSAQED
jgi:hypothetical protein